MVAMANCLLLSGSMRLSLAIHHLRSIVQMSNPRRQTKMCLGLFKKTVDTPLPV
jgi:hypothetical protein